MIITVSSGDIVSLFAVEWAFLFANKMNAFPFPPTISTVCTDAEFVNNKRIHRSVALKTFHHDIFIMLVEVRIVIKYFIGE